MKKTGAFLLALLLMLPLFVKADHHREYYEIFVASYCDSDGDGTGDLKGIAEKLPEIEYLGVTGLWLMPVHPSPSYHKYDVLDYYAIDPAYGTMADFEALASRCEEKGMALIIDLVLNHTSHLHPWFLSACKSIAVEPCGEISCPMEPLCRAHNPYCGYYHFSQEAGSNRRALSNGWYFEGVFGPHMPDLNLTNEAVVAELLQIADFWLQKGAAGFRLDAVVHFENNNVPFNNAFLRRLKERFPEAYFVGEVWSDAAVISRYYESGIDSLFNYPLATQDGSLIKAIRNGNGSAFAEKIAAWQETLKEINPSAIDAPFLSNHDNGRSAGFLMRDAALQKLAAAVYLFMPGNPFIYYGEELGMTGSGRDENKRQPYLWSVSDASGIPNPPPDCEQTQSLAEGYWEQKENPGSLLNTYRDLLKARKSRPEIARGTVTPLNLGLDTLCAYTSTYLDSSVTVVHNFSKEALSFEFDSRSFPVPAYGTLLIDDSDYEVF